MRASSVFRSTKFYIVASLAGACLVVGLVSLLVGSHLLQTTVLAEARNRVRLDLNAAREIYQSRVENISAALYIASLSDEFRAAVKAGDTRFLADRLSRVAKHAGLDFAGVVTADGKALCRLRPDSVPAGTAMGNNPWARYVLERRVPVSGTAVVNREFLLGEDPRLAEQARIALVATPMSPPHEGTEETSGMSIGAAVPVLENGELLGAVYGGTLINRSESIVDTVRDTVFQQETYKGRALGTATIFLGDVRISTNVPDREGKRAIGSRVSKAVRDAVLVEGKRWIDRAFVVHDWYVTAYEAIEDISGQRIGMLYVGILEAKYGDVRRHVIGMFTLVTAAGMVLAMALGFFLAGRIFRPIHGLIEASGEVSRGNLSPSIGRVSRSEIGVLQKTFGEMLASLREHEERRRRDSEQQLLQTEKQASVGRLAAGVAHEINNPLTGVLTFTHMLLRRTDLAENVRADLQTIARETERVRKIVKGLLEFSRQTRLDAEMTDLNKLVQSAVSLVENEALIKGVTLQFGPREGLPMRMVDRDQLKSALLNILINAIDATPSGGSVTVATDLSMAAGKQGRQGMEISVIDTGTGIPPENMDKLFEPFFTTKEVGQGTGLGLSVSLGIVERHGGTIRVKSEQGRGSTFTLWLPLESEQGKHEGAGS